MTIAVTDTLGSEHKLRMYVDWLRVHPEVDDCIVLSYRLDNFAQFDACDALVLTGGHDVDPRLYGERFPHPLVTDCDPRRDAFERRLLDRALGRGCPVLGVCRGLQLANVHLGGSLLPDIESAGYASHRAVNGIDARHGVVVEPDSLLGGIADGPGGDVNSNHHQCANAVAPALRVTARSGDGIAEALEWAAPGTRSFLLLVQWHPERMADRANPLAAGIRERFVVEAARTHEEHP